MSSMNITIDLLQNSLKICRLKDKVCKREMMNQNLQQKLFTHRMAPALSALLITSDATIDLCAHCVDHQRD